MTPPHDVSNPTAAAPSPSPVVTEAPAPAPTRHSFYESTARRRVAALLDAGSFREFLPPPERVVSPHLGALGVVGAFDDGVVIGAGRLDGKTVLVAAQEGGFIGGSVGEVHGAKIAGLLERARRDRPDAVLLLLESGGVRLHEANAGLIAVGGILRALLAARAEGVRVLALVGGPFGCFGGCGIVARCCEAVVISEEGRMGLSGPEVIESAMGVEEFDSRDRPLVWQTTGGKHRAAQGEAGPMVEDDVAAFRTAALGLMAQPAAGLTLENEEREHGRLAARLSESPAVSDHGSPQSHETQRTYAPSAADPAALPPNLFPAGCDIARDGDALAGTGQLADGRTVAILGTTDHAAVGVELALTLAGGVLATVREHPGRPIFLLVDTRGQRLSRRDELLGVNGYLAHLAKSLEVARRAGHRIVSLVYDEAVSGGFLSFGLMADAVFALPTANVRVMALPAMERVTKLPRERLEELARVSPVFAPGVENYVALGGVQALWPVDEALPARLTAALAPASPTLNLPPLARQIVAWVLAAT